MRGDIRLKSAIVLLTRYYAIQNSWGLSNEILCILSAQGAAMLPKIKLEGKKNENSGWAHN